MMKRITHFLRTFKSTMSNKTPVTSKKFKRKYLPRKAKMVQGKKRNIQHLLDNTECRGLHIRRKLTIKDKSMEQVVKPDAKLKREQQDDEPAEKTKIVHETSDKAIFHEGNIGEDFYSLRTEEQRKLCFMRIVQTNTKLREQLNEYKLLHCQQQTPDISDIGDEKALNNDELICFTLYPERKYKVGSLAQMHFRLAESQFFRLEEDNENYRVTKVEYFVNPVLVKRFREAQEKILTTRGEEYSCPVLAFHGTNEESMSSIVRTGFRLPSEPGYKQANDNGWYGRGIYLSEYPSYAREYMKRGGVSSKLLLCQVLVGKAFHCQERIDGEELKEGFDSHLSPEMHQLIIFNSHHVLPSYIVHFEKSDGDFRYKSSSDLVTAN